MSVLPEPVGYQYVTLRYVPRIEREEFLNVGVVLYSQMADYLDAAVHLDTDVISAVAPEADLTALQTSLDALCAAVRGIPCPGRPDLPRLGQRFGWVTAPRSTVVQPGPLHGGHTLDPAATLAHLMNRLVHRPGRG